MSHVSSRRSASQGGLVFSGSTICISPYLRPDQPVRVTWGLSAGALYVLQCLSTHWLSLEPMNSGELPLILEAGLTFVMSSHFMLGPAKIYHRSDQYPIPSLTCGKVTEAMLFRMELRRSKPSDQNCMAKGSLCPTLYCYFSFSFFPFLVFVLRQGLFMQS